MHNSQRKCSQWPLLRCFALYMPRCIFLLPLQATPFFEYAYSVTCCSFVALAWLLSFGRDCSDRVNVEERLELRFPECFRVSAPARKRREKTVVFPDSWPWSTVLGSPKGVNSTNRRTTNNVWRRVTAWKNLGHLHVKFRADLSTFWMHSMQKKRFFAAGGSARRSFARPRLVSTLLWTSYFACS